MTGNSLTRNALRLTSAKMVAFVLSFALPLVLVRWLSQTEFGLYRQVFLIINTTVAVLPLGYAMSAFYFFPRHPSKKAGVVFNILLFYLFVAGVAGLIIVFAPALLVAVSGGSGLIEQATPTLIATAVFFWVVASVFETLTVARGDIGLTTAVIVASQLSRALLLAGAAIFFGSVRALVWAAALQGLLQTAALLAYLDSRFPRLARKYDRHLMRAQLTYAMPFGVVAVLFSLQMELHNYFVSSRFGAAAYAIYSVGCLQIPLLSLVSDAVSSVMIPAVSHLGSQGRTREIVILTAQMMRKLAALYFAVYVLLLVTGRDLITVLFTRQYLDSWPIFAVNLTLIPFGLLASAYDPVVRAHPECLPFLVRTRVALSIVLVAGLWFGTGHFGLIGAIAAMVGVNVVERLVIAAKVGRILGVSWRDLALLSDVGKIALAAVAAGGGALLAHELVSGSGPLAVLIACGVTFAIGYVVAIVSLGVLTPEERAAIRSETARLQRRMVRKRSEASLV